MKKEKKKLIIRHLYYSIVTIGAHFYAHVNIVAHFS